jgi:transposase
MQQEQIETRKQRGYEIAKTSRIVKTDKGWKVPSQSGQGFYMVISDGKEAKCNCPDHELRSCKCKHIWAVEMIVTEEVDNNGNVKVTKTIRKTYRQDWHNYNISQQKEKELFMKLLADITGSISQPSYTFGRPSLPLSDMAYSVVFKVYSTFSGRRFTTDMKDAKEKGLIGSQPHYNSIFNYFAKKDLTPLLSQIVQLTSLPLSSVEHNFAIDSTGFGTSQFQRWFSFKHGREICSKRWVKCHFMTGVKSNIVTSVRITTELDNDSPELKALVQQTAENFDMKEITADKAYSSIDNHEIIAEAGATPYIAFKKNVTGKVGGGMWKKMYHYFMLNNDSFMEHYHQRSNAESTVHMIKSKFGDEVRSKLWTAQVNEVLAKVICHNIVCVIQEMNELGIEPNFNRL